MQLLTSEQYVFLSISRSYARVDLLGSNYRFCLIIVLQDQKSNKAHVETIGRVTFDDGVVRNSRR